MILMTGDTHGDSGRIERLCEKIKTTPEDVIIILGDAGINYYGGICDEITKKHLAALPITIFSIHGNHENRPCNIPSYQLMPWHGGEVYVEDAYPNLLFARDGDVYDLGGQKTAVIGGAYSVDKDYRRAMGWNWWADEQPSDEVKQRVEETLQQRNWQVDIVLSHTVPLKYEPTEVFMPGVNQSKADKTTEIWLDQIENRLQYRHWYAGHYHTNKDVGRLTILFDEIRELSAAE